MYIYNYCTYSVSKCAEMALDRVATSIGGRYVAPLVLERIGQHISSGEFNRASFVLHSIGHTPFNFSLIQYRYLYHSLLFLRPTLFQTLSDF